MKNSTRFKLALVLTFIGWDVLYIYNNFHIFSGGTLTSIDLLVLFINASLFGVLVITVTILIIGFGPSLWNQFMDWLNRH